MAGVCTCQAPVGKGLLRACLSWALLSQAWEPWDAPFARSAVGLTEMQRSLPASESSCSGILPDNTANLHASPSFPLLHAGWSWGTPGMWCWIRANHCHCRLGQDLTCDRPSRGQSAPGKDIPPSDKAKSFQDKASFHLPYSPQHTQFLPGMLCVM